MTRITHQTRDQQHPARAVHRRLLGFGSALVAFALDQTTKSAALAGVFAGYSDVLPFLDFVVVRNRGMSFGVLSGAGVPPYAFVILGVALAALLIVWLIRATDRTIAIALGLVIGGAFGNIATASAMVPSPISSICMRVTGTGLRLTSPMRRSAAGPHCSSLRASGGLRRDP